MDGDLRMAVNPVGKMKSKSLVSLERNMVMVLRPETTPIRPCMDELGGDLKSHKEKETTRVPVRSAHKDLGKLLKGAVDQCLCLSGAKCQNDKKKYNDTRCAAKGSALVTLTGCWAAYKTTTASASVQTRKRYVSLSKHFVVPRLAGCLT